MAGGMTVDYLVDAVFNVPTFSDAYKIAGAGRGQPPERDRSRQGRAERAIEADSAAGRWSLTSRSRPLPECSRMMLSLPACRGGDDGSGEGSFGVGLRADRRRAPAQPDEKHRETEQCDGYEESDGDPGERTLIGCEIDDPDDEADDCERDVADKRAARMPSLWFMPPARSHARNRTDPPSAVTTQATSAAHSMTEPPRLGDGGGLERLQRRAVDDAAVGGKARTVAGAIPGGLGVVPAHGAAHIVQAGETALSSPAGSRETAWSVPSMSTIAPCPRPISSTEPSLSLPPDGGQRSCSP